MTQDFVKSFKAARRVSTPLVAVRTPDAANTLRTIAASLNGKSEAPPLVYWNIMDGLQGLNQDGKGRVFAALGDADPRMASIKPSEALSFCSKLGKEVVVFFANAHRFWNDPVVAQGIWNLRDAYKTDGAMLVLLTSAGAVPPPELAGDVFVIDEPLPNVDELKQIVAGCYDATGLKSPDAETTEKAIDALIGLAAFPAEQSLQMCLTKAKGLDADMLWERKRQTIEQTPGLSVWRGGETFDQIGGVENIKTFLRAVLNGRDAPRVIVFIDEIEKAFAGSGTDLSGVTTQMTGTMLTWMQDRKADGIIAIGPPGCAKSVVAKAAGNTAGIPTIQFDLSAMQSSLVGSSGERLRSALKIVDAMSQGRALFIATCNSIGSLPPELRRRFTLGTFYFDLPSDDEREVIWPIYLKKYELADTKLPDDAGWTGSEIENCCKKAYRLKMTLREAAKFIVPVAKSSADKIKELRTQASGKFISASSPGAYVYEESAAALAPSRRRVRDIDVDVMTGPGQA